MSTEAITLEIDSEAAQAFKSVSVEEREKLQILLGIWLKEYAKTDAASLKETMDEIGRKAQSRGLTSEILESILEEE
jgi:ssDNA-binding replication factor A large subunit